VPAVDIGPTLKPALDVPTEPVQLSEPEPPEALQEVAPVEFQLRVVLCPVAIALDAAEKLPIEAGAGLTVSVAVPLPLVPLLPAHVRVKV
jgi:hypothetical protein